MRESRQGLPAPCKAVNEKSAPESQELLGSHLWAGPSPPSGWRQGGRRRSDWPQTTRHRHRHRSDSNPAHADAFAHCRLSTTTGCPRFLFLLPEFSPSFLLLKTCITYQQFYREGKKKTKPDQKAHQLWSALFPSLIGTCTFIFPCFASSTGKLPHVLSVPRNHATDPHAGRSAALLPRSLLNHPLITYVRILSGFFPICGQVGHLPPWACFCATSSRK